MESFPFKEVRGVVATWGLVPPIYGVRGPVPSGELLPIF